MEKFLVTIEFRYTDAPKQDGENEQYVTRKITIGVFDTRDLANEAGNKELEKFEAKFGLNLNYNRKERFSNHGGPFGAPKDLISNLGYIKTPFNFFAKIERLNYGDTDKEIDDAVLACKRHKEWDWSKED